MPYVIRECSGVAAMGFSMNSRNVCRIILTSSQIAGVFHVSFFWFSPFAHRTCKLFVFCFIITNILFSSCYFGSFPVFPQFSSSSTQLFVQPSNLHTNICQIEKISFELQEIKENCRYLYAGIMCICARYAFNHA